MRIISGTLKGILIQPPQGLPVRPTTDRAKESLFNILENHFDFTEIRALDLFSGTGNIAYELCSRGAVEVTAVDRDFKCISFIKEMKSKHSFEALKVVKRDALSFLKNEASACDIIFADAPYTNREIIQIPTLVANGNLLKPHGWLIVEHESNLDLSSESGFFDKRVYGQSAFSFFKAPTQL